MMRCALPELVIGDTFTVKYKNDSMLLKLVDIALWEELQTIKTIDVRQCKLGYYPSKEDKIKLQKQRKASKFVLRHGDIVTIKCRKDSTPYQISVDHGYKNENVLRDVHLNKLMNPTGAFR